jgi:hypothetical protein
MRGMYYAAQTVVTMTPALEDGIVVELRVMLLVTLARFAAPGYR